MTDAFRMLLVVGAVVATACDGTGPEDRIEGVELAFGDGGAYVAAGAPQFVGGEVAGETFAIAFADSVGGLVITSFQVTDGTRGDLLVLQLGSVAEGTFEPCGAGQECHGRILQGLDPENLDIAPAFFELAGGSVTISELEEERVAGSMADLEFLPTEDGSEPLTVSSGAFDLPLLSHDEGIAIMQCFLVRVTGGTCES